MDCAPKGRHVPSSSEYCKISKWMVRSLYQVGKLPNIAKEMTRMSIDVLGISETFWIDTGDFRYHLPNSKDFRVIFPGENEHKKAVAFVMRGISMSSIINYICKSQRIIIFRLSSKPKNPLLCQIYWPTASDSDEVMENFIAKIGKGKQGELVGLYGLEKGAKGRKD